MKDMHKEISQHSDAIAHLFKKWGNSPMKPNLSSWAFLDCVVDLSTMSFVERGQEHNCYARIPVRLLRKVNTEDELRLSRFLRSSFAGKESGLDLLLAACAIVARGGRVPDSLLIFIGKGGEGKKRFAPKPLPQSLGQRLRRFASSRNSERGRVQKSKAAIS